MTDRWNRSAVVRLVLIVVGLVAGGLSGVACSAGASPPCGAPGGPALGAPCPAGSGGAGGLVCAEGACRPACAGPAECADSLGCRGGACVPCGDHAECPGQYACRVGTGCLPLCHDTDDCKPGATCTAAGECRLLQGDGAMCAQADDCASGFCASGVCCATACAGGCRTCAGTTPGVCEDDPRPECTVKVPEQAATLAAALAAVADGGLIELAGDLTETVVIAGDRHVRIRGVGDPAPTLQAADPAAAALTITGTGSVELERLQLARSAFGLRVLAPVPVTARRLVVHHNQVGVAARHDTWTPAAVLRLEDSDVWLNAGDGLAVDGAPAEVVRVRLSANARNVRVAGVHAFRLATSVVAQANGRQGMMVVGSDNVLVEGSLFWENYPQSGLWLVDTSDATVRGSVFQGNAASGISLLRARAVTLERVAVHHQLDPRQPRFTWSTQPGLVNTGDLELPEITALPAPELAPDASLWVPPGDAPVANGVEIMNGNEVRLNNVDVNTNGGAGIFAWDSAATAISWSDVYDNRTNGISLSMSTNTVVFDTMVVGNAHAGVECWGGSVLVQSSSLSYTDATATGHAGYGLLASGGQHVVENSIFVDDALAGIAAQAGASVAVSGSLFSGSPVAWTWVVEGGASVTLGADNQITCELTPCGWESASLEAKPAPPPQSPFDD